MNKIPLKGKNLIISVVILMIGFIVSFLLSIMPIKSLSHINCSTIERVVCPGFTKSHITFNELNKVYLKKGQSITFQLVLPNYDYQLPVLTYYSAYCSLEVKGENGIIYSYGKDEDFREGKKRAGVGFHYISLKDVKPGSTITIQQVLLDPLVKTSFKTPYIEEATEAYSNLAKGNVFQYYLSILLITAGFLFLIMALSYLIITRKVLLVVLMSIFSIFSGLWIYTESCFIQMMTHSLWFIENIRNISFMCLTIPVLILLKTRTLTYQDDRIFLVMVLINVFEVFLSICLYVFKVWTTTLLLIFHVLFVLVIFVLFFTISFKSFKLSKRVDIVSVGSYLFLFTFYLIEIVLQILNFLGLIHLTFNISLFISIGLFGFIFITLIGFFTKYVGKVKEEDEKERLQILAYTDHLTKLGNRLKSDETAVALSKSKTEYVIITFDLNDLKKVNDKIGHHIGDRMIKAFASLLLEIFSDFGTVCRIGGDEFLVLLKGLNERKVKNLLSDLNIATTRYNEEEKLFQCSYAFGYAFSTEIPGKDPQGVIRKADFRMYLMKKEYHKINGSYR